jgi:hypothetical protein
MTARDVSYPGSQILKYRRFKISKLLLESAANHNQSKQSSSQQKHGCGFGNLHITVRASYE